MLYIYLHAFRYTFKDGPSYETTLPSWATAVETEDTGDGGAGVGGGGCADDGAGGGRTLDDGGGGSGGSIGGSSLGSGADARGTYEWGVGWSKFSEPTEV